SQVDLSWKDNSANETGFEIERSTDGTIFLPLTTVGANVTSYSDLAVIADATYYYRTRAFNLGGESAYSNTASVVLAPPAAPTNLAGSVTKNGPVTLTWKDNSNNETGFQVERST